MRVLTLPNAITSIRILLIPAFVTALVYRRHDYALGLFVVAGLSDGLDGLLARLTNQKTRLGAFLDPLADKFLLVTSFILFAVYGLVPVWLAIVVISRDLIVVTGWTLLYLLHGITRIQPSFIGKSAITLQLVLIAYTLIWINFTRLPAPGTWMYGAVAAFTIASGLQYVLQGLRQSNEK